MQSILNFISFCFKNQNHLSLEYWDSCQDEKICPITKEYFYQNQPIIRLPCSHIFSQNEIFKWLQLKPTCPLCRHTIYIHNMSLRETLYTPYLWT